MGSFAGAAFVPFAFFFLLKEYQQNRVLIFLDPESDPLGTGYHISQSKIAIGSGGIGGKGYLQGSQSHLDYLPEGHTDFVFATMAVGELNAQPPVSPSRAGATLSKSVW